MRTLALICAALLLPTACATQPAASEDCAPTTAELKALFHKLSPNHAGRELEVRYEGAVGRERLRKSAAARVAAGRRLGCACVNTRAYFEKRDAGTLALGGGTLMVIYDLETGEILDFYRER